MVRRMRQKLLCLTGNASQSIERFQCTCDCDRSIRTTRKLSSNRLPPSTTGSSSFTTESSTVSLCSILILAFKYFPLYKLRIVRDLVTGNVIKWEQRVRIRHLTTRKYLAISGKKVTLTDDHSDSSAVFRLYPVIKVGHVLKLLQYMYVVGYISNTNTPLVKQLYFLGLTKLS